MKKMKKHLSVVILVLLLVGVTLGFSALSANLNISGTSRISSSSWDVHFQNIAITSGSVTATTAPSTSNGGLTISYAVDLAEPGDFYEFTVDVKNAGSVPAKLSALPTISGVSEAQSAYTSYTFTHTDGTAIAVGETLAAGASKNFKVRVAYKSDIQANQLPTSAQNLTLTVAMQYVQA